MALPPTLNTLDDAQRMRLLRSTRKLEALLGATPMLVDTDHPVSPNPNVLRKSKSLRRQGVSPSASVTSFDSYAEILTYPQSAGMTPKSASYQSLPHFETVSNGGFLGPPLLRLNTGSGHHQRQPTTPLTPSAMAAGQVVTVPTHNRSVSTPISPSSATVGYDPAAERRRKMAKLTRTLGENIPPELVFHTLPSPALPPPLNNSAALTRSHSFHSKSPPASSTHPNSTTTASSTAASPPFADRTTRQRRRRSSSAILPGPVLTVPNPPRTSSSSQHAVRPPSGAPFAGILAEAAAVTAGGRPSYSSSSESSSEVHSPAGWQVVGKPKVVTDGWEGEWNMANMRDVQKKLRALKG